MTGNLRLHCHLAGGQLQGGAAGAVQGPGGAPQDGHHQAARLPQRHHPQHWPGSPHPRAPLPWPGVIQLLLCHSGFVSADVGTFAWCCASDSTCHFQQRSAEEPLHVWMLARDLYQQVQSTRLSKHASAAG